MRTLVHCGLTAEVTVDPFSTLGLEPRFDLERAALDERHRELSKALHPDRYASAPAAERRMALSRAIEVNEAARALRDPVKRAEAILALAGVPVGETSEPKASPDLLMEMMEAREELAFAARNKDAAAIERLGSGMTARERAIQDELARKLAGADPRSALALLGELRYTRRFLDEVRALEEAMAT